MDEVIFEEFKGTGNMEIHFDRRLVDRRVFPSIDIQRSGTRKEELLLDKNDINRIWLLRKVLQPMNTVESMEFLLEKMHSHQEQSRFPGLHESVIFREWNVEVESGKKIVSFFPHSTLHLLTRS